MTIRVTRKTARLLRVLLNLDADRDYAARSGETFRLTNKAMIKEARLSPNTFYVLIDRLRRNRWIKAEREEVGAEENRAPHTYYHLTKEGVTHARAALKKRDDRIWNKILRR